MRSRFSITRPKLWRNLLRSRVSATTSTVVPLSQKREQSRNFQNPRESKFNPALSGLRGAASFGVVLFHATGFFHFPFTSLTGTFYLGVPVFLMMSMCLLLSRLDENRNLKHYFKRRILRIWPIYYGSLVAFYLIFRFPFWDFVRYMFFVEYYVNPFGFFPVSIFWTLQLEEAVYLFIPLIQRLGKNDREIVALTFILGGFAFLSYLSRTALGIHPIIYFQMLLPVSVIAYGFGILINIGIIPSRVRWLSIVGILGYALLNAARHESYHLGYYQSFFISNVLLYSISLLGFAAIVSRPPRFLGWLAFLGEESYALYAIHYALVLLYGLPGIAYSVGLAFFIEFCLRPREMSRRLVYSYSQLLRVNENRKEYWKSKVSVLLRMHSIT